MISCIVVDFNWTLWLICKNTSYQSVRERGPLGYIHCCTWCLHSCIVIFFYIRMRLSERIFMLLAVKSSLLLMFHPASWEFYVSRHTNLLLSIHVTDRLTTHIMFYDLSHLSRSMRWMSILNTHHKDSVLQCWQTDVSLILSLYRSLWIKLN